MFSTAEISNMMSLFVNNLYLCLFSHWTIFYIQATQTGLRIPVEDNRSNNYVDQDINSFNVHSWQYANDKAVHGKPWHQNQSFSWLNSSQIYTLIIAILLVLYGSFRSMKVKDGGNSSSQENLDDTASEHSLLQTINSNQALFLPIGTSLVLVGTFLFDGMQVVFAAFSTVMACFAFIYLTLPTSQNIMRYFAISEKVPAACFGRCSPAVILSVFLSVTFVSVWILTGHWLLLDALSVGLCVCMIALLRLPSLKVTCMLLIGLLVYDVFWVFFSARFFSTNVMMKVATAKADNPMKLLAQKLNWKGAENAPQLPLPGKLVIPNFVTKFGKSNFSVIGLGDVVIPGLMLCFVMRFDNHKKKIADEGSYAPKLSHRVRYFHCTLLGYVIGLGSAVLASNLSNNPQPVLLYVVPLTLLPLVTLAYIKGDLRQMWNNPFKVITQRIDV